MSDKKYVHVKIMNSDIVYYVVGSMVVYGLFFKERLRGMFGILSWILLWLLSVCISTIPQFQTKLGGEWSDFDSKTRFGIVIKFSSYD
jgi:hypothetical protein